MKRKILIFFVIFTLLFSSFSIFSYAEDSSDKVLEEYEQNYPNVDLSKLTGTKRRVIGAVEDIIDEYSLYLYVYEEMPHYSGGRIEGLSYEFVDFSGNVKNGTLNIRGLEYITSSRLGNITKYRANLSDLSEELDTYNFKHSYSFDSLYFGYPSGYWISQNCSYEFDYTDSDNIKITYEQSEVAKLDVHYTHYRTEKVEKYSVFDEIHTVYFSIPEEYTKFYKNLYSVASTYTKKRTTPIFITSNSRYFRVPINSRLESLNNNTLLSYDYECYEYMGSYIYESDLGFNVKNDASGWVTTDYIINYKEIKDDIFYFFYCDKEIKELEDLRISSEELLNYIDSCEEIGCNYELFESSEYFSWSEKTIEDRFDSISYSTQIQGDYSAIEEEYGFKVAFLLWWYRNSPDKLQELYEKYLVDVNKDLNNEPYLLLCDDTVRADAEKLSKEDFSNKYLIHIDDVGEFIEFLNNNENVILYRFDVSEVYSERVVCGSLNEDFVFEIFTNDRDYYHCITQQYIYKDFQVIDVTFKDGDSFVSLCVNSDPQDVTGDPGLEEDVPPIILNPTLPSIKDIFNDDDNSVLKTIIRVIVVLIGVTFLVIGTKLFIGFVVEKNKNKKE